MLVSEPMGMLHWQTLPTRPHILSGINSDQLSRWAEAVASQGSLMIGQVQDNGRGFRAGFRNLEARGASALPDDLSWTVPHALETSAVYQMIDEFVTSCEFLRKAGFAGVEISAGHGHLFHQFLSARSNVRDDEFGGDIEGRATLLMQLMRGIRERCGGDFLIGAKLPAEDGMTGGIGLAEAEAITKLLGRSGDMDYLTYCWGSHSETLYTHLPDNHGPRMPYVEKIHRLGRAAAPNTPLGALGLITDPNEGDTIIRDGLADLVMLARPLIADPAWGAKARDGREAEIRYCVSCNTCWHMIASGRGLQCDNNPRVGEPDEADWRAPRAIGAKRIVVVGAGIAGMEAAWTAAARGHEVHLFGASEEPGGKARLHATLPGGEGLSSIYNYQELAARRYGVKMRMGEMADAAAVLDLEPDVVVLATGSTPTWPSFLSSEYREEGLVPDLREAVRLLASYAGGNLGTAVIYDEDHGAFTYDAAEFLLERFENLVILTPRERLASDESLILRQGVYQRLYRRGVEVVTSVRPVSGDGLSDGDLVYANVYSGQQRKIGGVAFLTFATQRVPNLELARPLSSAGMDVRVIGDCRAPRIPLSATAEGSRLALEL